MKKFWKLSVCALAATFAFSAVTACGDDNAKEVKSNITADQVLAIGDKLEESLAGVQSFGMGVSSKMYQKTPGYLSDNSGEFTALVNIGENGLSAKGTGTLKMKEIDDEYPEFNTDMTESVEGYILDGFAYGQSLEDSTVYVKTSRPIMVELNEAFEESFDMTLEEAIEQINAMQNGEELPDIPVDEIKRLLNDEFLLIKKGDTTRITLDLKDELNEFFAYYGSLTVDSKLGDIVNHTLAMIDDEFTWQNITELVKGTGSYTVSQLVTALNSELYASSGMTLQEVKDTVLATPDIYNLLVEEVGIENADMVVNTTVAEFLTEYGEATMDDLTKLMTEDETMTVATAVAQLETLLSTKLGDIMMDEEDKMSFDLVTTALKAIKVNELNANLSFKMSGDKVTRIEVSYNFKLTATVEGQKSTISMNYSMYAGDFSEEAQTISLPAGATVKVFCDGDDCEEIVSDSDYCADCQAYICASCHEGVEHLKS